MSKVPKPPASAGVTLAELPFEEALRKLETIVESMEAEDLPLETLLARHEEGVKLVEVCQAKLAAAEVRIQQLEKNATGETVLKPLAPLPSS